MFMCDERFHFFFRYLACVQRTKTLDGKRVLENDFSRCQFTFCVRTGSSEEVEFSLQHPTAFQPFLLFNYPSIITNEIDLQPQVLLVSNRNHLSFPLINLAGDFQNYFSSVFKLQRLLMYVSLYIDLFDFRRANYFILRLSIIMFEQNYLGSKLGLTSIIVISSASFYR